MESAMTIRKLARRWKRPARDFALGLGLYAVFALSGITELVSSGHLFGSSAQAQLLEASELEAVKAFTADWSTTVQSLAASVELRQRAMITSAMFAFAFASMFALNMWFGRHLRFVHLAHVRASRRRAG
jgi:hypothetical protein